MFECRALLLRIFNEESELVNNTQKRQQSQPKKEAASPVSDDTKQEDLSVADGIDASENGYMERNKPATETASGTTISIAQA
jgi:hypothetical protein